MVERIKEIGFEVFN